MRFACFRALRVRNIGVEEWVLAEKDLVTTLETEDLGVR